MEKRALEVFSTSAGRVLSRDYLLDSISEQGSEKRDRNIDFLINRLRAKLGENARNPRFIETRYGEGYVWLYKDMQPDLTPSTAFVVIAPPKGVAALGESKDNGLAMVSFLRSDLEKEIPEGATVLIAPEPAAETAYAPETVEDLPTTPRAENIDLQLSFFRDGAQVECVVAARRVPGGHIIFVDRFPIDDGVAGYSGLSLRARSMTRSIMANYWKDIAQQGVDDVPLPVAMHAASDMPKNANAWAMADRRLKDLRKAQPDDPALHMMWATHLHTKYVLNGYDLFTQGTDTCAADEAEIEASVHAALDYVQSRPELAVVAAKLLYFVDPGYRDLALDLALRAHRSNTAIASSFAIVGQLHSFTGNMEAAESYLSQAVHLSTPKSEFHIYALTLLCQMYKAAGDGQTLSDTLKRLYKIRPATFFIFEPIFGDPTHPSLRAKALAFTMSRRRATGLLKFVTYLSARLFEEPKHRENSLLTPVNLLVRRFGPDVVPAETARHLPHLAQVSNAATRRGA